MNETETSEATESTAAKWSPLSAIERRVAGVLVEKAKTTPSGYPMTLNAICTACNQKSNRSPLMELEADDVQTALDRLRQIKAVGEIHDGGRAAKYRHYLYDWLGVDKVELAVMAELLLRGEQTLGDLRTRAARMESIADQTALRPIVDSLAGKGLIVELTPSGRGQIVTHAVYLPRELDKLKARFAGGASSGEEDDGDDSPRSNASISQPRSSNPADDRSPLAEEVRSLRSDLDELRTQVESLRTRLEELL